MGDQEPTREVKECVCVCVKGGGAACACAHIAFARDMHGHEGNDLWPGLAVCIDRCRMRRLGEGQA